MIHQNTWSPRISLSIAPFPARTTRLFGGFAVTVDAADLQQFSQPLDQLSTSTQYVNGQPVGLPGVQVYTIPVRGRKDNAAREMPQFLRRTTQASFHGEGFPLVVDRNQEPGIRSIIDEKANYWAK